MKDKPSILAICGSTRSNSVNLQLIRTIQNLYQYKISIQLSEDIRNIPHFNPDLANSNLPHPVTIFRKQISDADGVLICTPEYAMGVPGSLKNAIDWTVSSCEFSHKPVALITASSMGAKAHESLLETLKVIEAAVTDDTQLLISFVRMKIDSEGEIKDEKTAAELNLLMNAFIRLARNPPEI